MKGKKINCMRTIGEVYVASPLLLLDTNCLLITALFALRGGDSTESQLLPQTQMASASTELSTVGGDLKQAQPRA